jgi:hypothetical protein
MNSNEPLAGRGTITRPFLPAGNVAFVQRTVNCVQDNGVAGL